MADVPTGLISKDVQEDSPTPSLEKLLKAVHGEKNKNTEAAHLLNTSDGRDQDVQTLGVIDMEEIEVIDGMALLEESEGKEDHKESSEVFLESGVEIGYALPPSKYKIGTKVPAREAQEAKSSAPALTFPFENVQGGYRIENNMAISHDELAIGGEIPENQIMKDHLIHKLRLFINKLNDHLEQSEGSTVALQKEYYKRIDQVKESEELVKQLTGRITEQATAVSEQMRELDAARESAKKERAVPKKEVPAALPRIVENQVPQVLINNSTGENNAIGVGNEDTDEMDRVIINEMLKNGSFPTFPGLTYKLTIKRPPIGFTVVTEDGSHYAKVGSVSRNDLKKAGLAAGLEIMNVNEKNLKDMPAEQVLQEIGNRMKSSVTIRMRKPLDPWRKYQEYSTTSWGTKKAKTTWTLYCARAKPRIVVLEHNQRKGKSKRKVVIDGEVRYERKSTQELFKINLESGDVLILMIDRTPEKAYEYTMQINSLSFSRARKSFFENLKAINFV